MERPGPPWQPLILTGANRKKNLLWELPKPGQKLHTDHALGSQGPVGEQRLFGIHAAERGGFGGFEGLLRGGCPAFLCLAKRLARRRCVGSAALTGGPGWGKDLRLQPVEDSSCRAFFIAMACDRFF